MNNREDILRRLTSALEDGDELEDILNVLMAMSAACCGELDVSGNRIEMPDGTIIAFEITEPGDEKVIWQ